MSNPAKVLAAVELRQLLEHVDEGPLAKRNTCVVLLSFRAGLRACEIAGLEWGMVLRSDGRLSEHLSIAGSIAKNGRARQLPIHPMLAAALRHLHRSSERPMRGPIIRSQRGGHMTAGSVVNWFTATYAELGFDGCSSHSGRRTFITQMARLIGKAGGSLRDIQELAGHRALSTTERYIVGDREAQHKLVRLL